MNKLSSIVLVLAVAAAGSLMAADTAKLLKLKQEGEQAFADERFADAASAFEKFVEELPDTSFYQSSRAHANYYVACAYSRLAGTSEKDEVASFTSKAVGALSKAFASGFDRLDYVERDPDLDSIRSSKEFKALVTKYQKMAEEKLQGFDFSLKTLDGKPISKKDFVGKVLIVDIWGTWCPPCRQEIPHFIELQKKYGKDGLQIVGLNHEKAPNPEAVVKQFIRANGINYPCAMVTRDVLGTVPDFSGFPTTIFIGRDGRVRKKVVGYHPIAQLEAIVKPLLAEKASAKKKES